MNTSDVKQELLEKELREEERIQLCSVLVKLLTYGADTGSLRFDTETAEIAFFFAKFLQEHYGVRAKIAMIRPQQGRKNRFVIELHAKTADKLFADLELQAETIGEGVVAVFQRNFLHLPDHDVRIVLRGVFLALGSFGMPEKEHSGYYLELVFWDSEFLDIVKKLASGYDIIFKDGDKGENKMLYLKSAEQISDFLALIGADRMVLALNCVIADRMMRNEVNRKNNCGIGNIKKAIAAAEKQTEAIRLIERVRGLESLPKNLYDAARLRIEYPDYTLEEIGAELDPPTGKSGVNHRFRKIMEIAEQMKNQ